MRILWFIFVLFLAFSSITFASNDRDSIDINILNDSIITITTRQADLKTVLSKIADKSNITDHLIRLAGEMAEKHALRGFDAIHLASAVLFHQDLSSPVIFSCYDNNLSIAAEREGLIKK